MNKLWLVILFLILAPSMVQSQSENYDELVRFRDQIFRNLEEGFQPNPTEENQKMLGKKAEAPLNKCESVWLANLPDFYATDSEEVSIVVNNGFFFGAPSIERNRFSFDKENKIFRVQSYVDVFTGCDGCLGLMVRDSLYKGQLEAGDYTVIYQRNCSLNPTSNFIEDTLQFTIHPSHPKETVIEQKEKRIKEQFPDNLPPLIDMEYRGKVKITYALHEPEWIGFYIVNLDGEVLCTLLEPTLFTDLGYQELLLDVPEFLKNRKFKDDGSDYLKGVVTIGETKFESEVCICWWHRR